MLLAMCLQINQVKLWDSSVYFEQWVGCLSENRTSERYKILRIGFPFKNWVSQDPVGASLVAQVVKNLPAMQETQVSSLHQGDPLDKGMATYSSVLARRIP